MHQTLEVPEILFLVFKCDLSEQDLLSCALVCRLWGLWAPDVLWRTHRVPLQAVLRTLASVTQTIMKYKGTSIIPFVEIGHIGENHWRRFLALSNKVTEVTVDCGLSEASLKCIKLAKQKFTGDPFSQLRTLAMTVHDEDHKAISMVAVPSLTRVYLRCTRLEPVALDWVTDTLPEIAPKVAHLEINLLWMNKRFGVSRYSALEHLELRTESLAEKKKLEQLRKEREDERQIQELQRLQEEQTEKKRQEKVDWMCATPATGGGSNNENEKVGASRKIFITNQNANTPRDTAA
ncbi:hypothetical protein FS837_009284 [Tulasnella sp. UAMH 9824]|nr:hypothetical protein FS837_009284 [Tulasnella sp. UAMH 9824]